MTSASRKKKTDDKKGKKDKNQIMSNQRSQTNEFPDKSDMWVTSPFPPNPKPASQTK